MSNPTLKEQRKKIVKEIEALMNQRQTYLDNANDIMKEADKKTVILLEILNKMSKRK